MSVRWAAPRYRATIERCLQEHAEETGAKTDKIAIARAWRDAMKAATKLRFALVEADGMTVGIMVVHDHYDVLAGGKLLRCEDLYIAPDHRGQGFKRKLVAFAEQQARREKAVEVEYVFTNHEQIPSLPDLQPLEVHVMRRSVVPGKTTPRRAAGAGRARTAKAEKRTGVPKGKQLTALFDKRQSAPTGHPKPK